MRVDLCFTTPSMFPSTTVSTVLKDLAFCLHHMLPGVRKLCKWARRLFLVEGSFVSQWFTICLQTPKSQYFIFGARKEILRSSRVCFNSQIVSRISFLSFPFHCLWLGLPRRCFFFFGGPSELALCYPVPLLLCCLASKRSISKKFGASLHHSGFTTAICPTFTRCVDDQGDDPSEVSD